MARCCQLGIGGTLKLFFHIPSLRRLSLSLDALLQSYISFLINSTQKEEESCGGKEDEDQKKSQGESEHPCCLWNSPWRMFTGKLPKKATETEVLVKGVLEQKDTLSNIMSLKLNYFLAHRVFMLFVFGLTLVPLSQIQQSPQGSGFIALRALIRSWIDIGCFLPIFMTT